MAFPSDRLDSPFLQSKMLIMSLNERFGQHLMKFQVLCFLLGIKKRYEKNFFSLLDAKRLAATYYKYFAYVVDYVNFHEMLHSEQI